MYCNHCGEVVPEGSRFCNHCGRPLAFQAEVAGVLPFRRPDGLATREDADEHVIFVLRPTLIFVAVWYVVAAFLVLVSAGVMGLLGNQVNGQTAFYVIMGAAVLAFAIPFYKHIQRMREVYTLTNHKLEMRFGLIAKTVRNIPLRNVQDVTVTSRAGERILGLGDIVIDSASESGKITWSNIHHPERYADQILGELRRRY